MKNPVSLFLTAALCLLLSLPPCQASPEEPAGAEGFDIELLMDSSGSMKKTDPQNYRQAAARLFITLLSRNDRIGIISFGDAARTLLPLTQNNQASQGSLAEALKKISSKESSTNIQEGVRKGFKELSSSQRKQRVMLLMSDGKLTLGSRKKEEAALNELSLLLPEIAKADIRLYTIAFTELSDMKLLEEMAQATGGFSRLAKTDKDIHLIFASIFEKLKSPDTIPLEGDSFTIDNEIKEAIVLISKKEGVTTTLVDPSGKKNSPARLARNISWYEAKLFDMITINAPEAGKWRVNLSVREGNKVYVITDLKLMSSFDKSYVHKGERLKIPLWLEKEGAVLAERDVLAQVSFKATVLRPDGSAVQLEMQDNALDGDEKAGDGIYTGELSAGDLGEYAVTLKAEAKTFTREKTWQFKATAPVTPEKRPEPRPQVREKTSEGSWPDVLIPFGIVNVVILLIAAVWYIVRRKRAALRKE